jgi:hypothetical protein
LVLGQANISIRGLTVAATWLCLLADATTGANAAREVDEQMEEVGPQAVAIICATDLTEAQYRACEDAVMRWKLCQRVYLSQPNPDDAFYACFEGEN